MANERDENLDTHDIQVSVMSPSWCRRCQLSGRELGLRSCPVQEKVIDMEQAKPKSQDKVTAKPPKHSCTAEIIAELERHAPDWVSINDDGTINARAVYDEIDRLKLKAKETQL